MQSIRHMYYTAAQEPSRWYRDPMAWLRMSLGKARRFLGTSEDSATVLALSIAVGVCTGVLPIWGFQTLAAMGLAFCFRLNKTVVFMVSNFSQPPVTPVILYASFLLGGIFPIEGSSSGFSLSTINESVLQNCMEQYLLGSALLAVLLSALSGVLSYACILRYRSSRGRA